MTLTVIGDEARPDVDLVAAKIRPEIFDAVPEPVEVISPAAVTSRTILMMLVMVCTLPLVSSGEPGNVDAGIVQRLTYYVENEEPARAGRVWQVWRGDELRQTFDYAFTPDGGTIETITDVPEQRRTTNRHDAEGRLIRSEVEPIDGSADPVIERYAYDILGRLAWTARTQTGVGLVETRTTYDAMGRPVSVRSTGNSVVPDADTVDPVVADLVVDTEYRIAHRRRIEYMPGIGARGASGVEIELDSLGREIRRRTFGADPDTPQVEQHTGYDIHGDAVHVSDGVRRASLSSVDSLGRTTETVASDGVRERFSYDSFDRVTAQETFIVDESGVETTVALSDAAFSEQGRTIRQRAHVDQARALVTTNRWLHSGLLTSMTSGEGRPDDLEPQSARRAVTELRDRAGRTIEQAILGASAAGGEAVPVSVVSFGRFRGDIPQLQRVIDRVAGRETASTTDHDFLGRVTSTLEASTFATRARWDEAGNVVESALPGRPAQSMRFDARGLLLRHELEDGSAIDRAYDARGQLRRYVDQEGKVTRYDTDSIGRPFRIRYPDGTTEETRHEPLTGEIIASRDRAGEWTTYVFDSGGRIIEERYGGNGDEPQMGGPIVLRRVFDAAGRLLSEIQRDVALEYADFDLLGRPGVTRTLRYDTSGCDPYSKLPCGNGPVDGRDVQPVEVYTQLHRWSVYSDERERWRMPFRGATEPAAAEEGWRRWIVEERDETGSIIRIGEAADAASLPVEELLRITRRGAGQMHERSRRLASGEWLTTRYGYADAAAEGGAVPQIDPHVVEGEAPTGRLAEAVSSVGGVAIAGSRTRLGADRLLERSDSVAMPSRASSWTYDDRGRLSTAALQVEAVEAIAENVVYTLSDADRVDVRTTLPAALPGAHAPPAWAVTDASETHQILTLRESSSDSTSTREYSWSGGRRTSDGVWTATWDLRGRLIVMEVPALGRRVRYAWSPSDRLVGRVQERLTDAGTWVTEIRPEFLNGIPAEATFVWDYATDRLVAIFDSAAARAASPDALVRQYLHGDAAYDDPIEVTLRSTSGVEHFYPVRDEAATGSLEAVVDSSGAIVERVVYGDAYGDGVRYLHGAVLERITRGSGTGPQLELHFTDAVIADTLAGAVTVTARSADGSLERLEITSIAPTTNGAAITLPFDSWSTLESTYTELHVAISDAVRFDGWGDRPAHSYIAPDIEGSTANIAISIPLTTGPPTENLFTLSTLHEIASITSRTNLHLGIHTTPFADPATGHHYIRARWYDPSTATFITPDPMGYADSSNAYAGFAGDPVNNFDPRGEWVGVDNFVAGIASVAIGYAATCVLDECSNYSWKDGAVDFGLGFATTGLSSIKKIHQLGNASRWGARVGLEAGLDLGAETTRRWLHGEKLGEDYTAGELARGTFLNFAAGEVGSFSGRVFERVRKSYSSSAPASNLGIASRVAREVLRPIFRGISYLSPTVARPFESLSMSQRIERVFVTPRLHHPGVSYSPVGKRLKRYLPSLELQMHHVAIQRKWFAGDKSNQWYPEDGRARRGLRMVGNAGWNLLPLPARWNRSLGRHPWRTTSVAAALYGGAATAGFGMFNMVFSDEE